MAVIPLDLTEIDWSNPDVIKVFEALSEKFEQKDKVISEQAAVISELTDKVAQLEEMLKIKTSKHTSHKK